MGGFKATKTAIHGVQGHGETSGKDIVRCWYEARCDTPGKSFKHALEPTSTQRRELTPHPCPNPGKKNMYMDKHRIVHSEPMATTNFTHWSRSYATIFSESMH